MSTCCEPRRSRAAATMVAIQSKPLRGLNAGGCAGHAEAQLVVRRQRNFVDARCGVDHAFGIGGVNLERSVVRGDERPCARLEKEMRDRNGKRGAFFRIGGGAEFIEQHERTWSGEPREAVEIGDVRGEGGERCLNGLSVADVGEKSGEAPGNWRRWRERAGRPAPSWPAARWF